MENMEIIRDRDDVASHLIPKGVGYNSDLSVSIVVFCAGLITGQESAGGQYLIFVLCEEEFESKRWLQRGSVSLVAESRIRRIVGMQLKYIRNALEQIPGFEWKWK